MKKRLKSYLLNLLHNLEVSIHSAAVKLGADTESEENIKYRKDFIRRVHEVGDFIEDVDGSFYYWPTFYIDEQLNPGQLRMIADELDRLNEPWQKEIMGSPQQTTSSLCTSITKP